MIVGIGIDIAEIARIEKNMGNGNFMRRIFGERELESLKTAQSFAAAFAAKEAFGKALGLGLSGFDLVDVQLLRKETGAPYLALSGKAAKLGEGFEFLVSVTHEAGVAAAVIFAQKEDIK